MTHGIIVIICIDYAFCVGSLNSYKECTNVEESLNFIFDFLRTVA